MDLNLLQVFVVRASERIVLKIVDEIVQILRIMSQGLVNVFIVVGAIVPQ